MNRNFYKIIFIFSLIISSGKNFYSQNPAACNNLTNLCTNSVFSFSAGSGTGLTAGLNISNPFANPQAVNVGCMFTNVANPQWLLLNITTGGNLGFSFGAFGSAFPQAGNYDWIMWPYSPTACNDIFNNILPPVACNWNCTGGGGTGMGTVPAGGSPCNFQPSIPVLQGQQYIILITNPSGVNTPVSFSMTGSAAVSCNPILFNNQTACPGQQAVFTGTWVNSSGGSYTLQPGNIVQASPSFTVSSLTTQVYTVSAQGTNLSAIPIADQTTFTLNINPIIPISVTTPTNFCYGSNATFTVSPAGTGTFNVTGPSAPTTSFATTSIAYPNVTTPNIGTFTIAASYTNGCTGTQTAQINVSPNHSITVSSNTNVCMNGTVNLTSSMPTATAYAWTGPNAFNSAAQNPVLNTMQPIESGVYTVTSNINFNGITCLRSNTVQVAVVTTSAVAVTPNFTLCQASNLNLTSNATGAFSYSWTGPGTYTSGLQNPTVSGILPSGAGNYTSTAYFTNGSLTCTRSAVSNVSVVATSTVNIAVPQNTCQNANINLSMTATGATGFNWAGPNSFTSTNASTNIVNVQPVASGIYTATATFSIGAVTCSTSSTASMNVVATSTVAVIPSFTVCQGSSLNLISNAVGAASYSWNGPGAYTSSSPNPLLTSILPSAAGNYSAIASFTNGVLTCTTGAVSNVSVVATSPVTLTIPTHTCQHANINLSMAATGATGFNWAGPNGFTSTNASTNIVNVQPVASGIYTATTTFSIGAVTCSTSNTASLSVVSTSTVAVTPNFTVCQGSNLNLLSNATSAGSYSWSGPGGFTSAAQNTLVLGMLPSGAGNYTSTAYFTDGVLTCTTAAVSNVSVVATSTVNIAVPQHTCQNANINLSMTATGATGFNWAGPNGFTSTNASTNIVNVQPIASGIYTSTATFSIGAVTCSTSSTASMNVVSTSTVAVIPNFTVCQGSSLNLISNAAGAASYSWNGPGTYTSGVQNPLLTAILPSAAGNYSAIASFTNGVLTCTTGAVTNVSVVATSTVNIAVPQHTCQNATINLNMTATGATGFNWAGPNGFTSTNASTNIVNVQPVASGIYTATATFSIGAVTCSTSSTASMNVVPTNTVAVTPNFTLCQGASLNLVSNAGAVSYSWNGPGGFTSAAQNTLVLGMLPSGAGNYTSTAYFTDGVLTCTTAAVSNVSVVPTSTVNIAVPQHTCQNATINLNMTATGATGFNWAGPNGFTSTNASTNIVNVQPIASGIYTATATFSIGAVTCSTSSTASMNVVPTSTVFVIPNFTVCEGTSLNLISNASGAASYSWNGPGSYNSPSQNPLLTSILPSAAGNYSAIASFTNGVLTCTTGAVTNVSVVATPTTAITYSPNICQNATANFAALAPGAVSYTWTGPNSFSATGATASIPGIQTNGSGIYTTTTLFSIGTVSCLTSVTNSVNVVGTNTVAVSPNFTICAGATVTLTSNASAANSYSWNGPGGYTSSSQNPTIPGILTTGTGVYTATAFFISNSYTCSTFATLNGSVIAIPQLTVSATTTVICATESATLNASGSLNYTWTPAATLNTGNGPTVIGNPLVTTVYSITGQDASGCFKSNTITLAVNPLPTLTAISNTMCFGTTASLTAGGATAYTWAPAGSLSSANGSTVSASPATTTIYTITGASNKGCLNTTTASVLVKPLPVLTIADHTICLGKSANVSVSGATNYTWSPAGTLNTATQPNVIATPTQNTTYTVIGQDVNGCISSTISNVIVNSLPVIAITSPGTICAGQSAPLSASGANTYTWSNGPQTSLQLVSPVISTVYTVTGKDGNGCINTNTVFLNVLIQPTLNITGSPTVCLGNLLTLTASGGPDYTWDTGETTNVITIAPDSSAVYTVSSGIAPCNSSTVFAVTVYTPQIPASYAVPSTIIYGASSVINANVPVGNSFNWLSSPDISCNACQTNTVTPTTTTIYSLTLTDSQGCIITNTVLVEVDIICGEVFAPSAFSPNGDGFNDFWCVYGNCLNSMSLQLYNRWGEKVFESNDKSICWDGTYNGVMQNDAVFIYQLTTTLVNGDKIVKKGNLTLKR